jgi:hypothetical protein
MTLKYHTTKYSMIGTWKIIIIVFLKQQLILQELKVCHQLATPYGLPWQPDFISSHIHNVLTSNLMMRASFFSKLSLPLLRAHVTRTQHIFTYSPVGQKVPRKLEVVGTGREHVMLLWYH